MRYLIILLLLTGCATPQFTPTEYRTDVEVTVIKRDNIPHYLNSATVKILGATHCYTDKKCTIWIPTGDTACAKEVEAHEKLHVKYGLFHDEHFRLKDCG